MTRIIFALALILPLPAMAAQNLIATPYPSTGSGATSLNPSTPSTGTTQTNMGSPYPQATGAGSQGNPAVMGTGGSQQGVPSTYQEKYGVQQK